MKKTLITVICGGMLLAGCSKKTEDVTAEKPEKAATGARIDIRKDGNKVTVRTADGEVTGMAGESLEKPADFPADVYCCKGQIKSALKQPKGQELCIKASETSDKIVADARTFMTGKGWKEMMFMDRSNVKILSFTKDDGKRTCMLSTSDDKDKTIVVITVSHK